MSLPEHNACACCTPQPVDASRRRIIKMVTAASLVAPLALAASPAHAQARQDKPADGDRLVEEDAEGGPVPLRLADIRVGKPVLAFPFDPALKQVRDGSRLNKVVLMRFAESDLDDQTRAHAAGGVIAFSAICTHQGCDLKTWSAKEQVLVCFCHSSKFRLREGGVVAAGPAQRTLPSLPLKLVGEHIVIAGAFSAPPGGQPV